MNRKAVTPLTQADVVIKSKRRCALCFGINNDLSEKTGQIAHLDKDNTNSNFENLAWLCLDHHDKYDSKTSQTKNYTEIEVRNYRDQLYQNFESSDYSAEDIQLVRRYLTEFSAIFEYIFTEYEELAYRVDSNMFDSLVNIRDFWHTNSLRSFNQKVRELQDRIANNVVGICSIYEYDKYDLVGNYIKFDNQNFRHDILTEKRQQVRENVDAIGNYFKQLQAIAVK